MQQIARSKVIEVSNDKVLEKYQAMAYEEKWTEKLSTVQQFRVPQQVPLCNLQDMSHHQ